MYKFDEFGKQSDYFTVKNIKSISLYSSAHIWFGATVRVGAKWRVPVRLG